MPLSKKSFWITFSFLILMGPPMACTNLKLGQTSVRFYENMTGSLRTFNNFSPVSSTNFSFGAFGDIHTGSPGGDLYLRALQASKGDGDEFGITLGDNSTGGTESEILTFYNQGISQGVTIYPAIGNHDIFFGGWNNYKTIIGRSIYSFNAGVAHFIVLDNANGTFGEEQLNWLQKDLAATSQPVKIVYMHFPVYMGEFSSIYKVSSDEEITIFKNMMDTYNVQLVLAAHYHGYGDWTLGHTHYVVSGACNHILDIGNKSAYLKVTVNNSLVAVAQKFLP